MPSLVERGLRSLQSRGVQKGVFGSSRPWFWVAVVSWVFRRLRKATVRQPEVVFRGRVEQGSTIQISHLDETYGEAEHGRRKRRGK